MDESNDEEKSTLSLKVTEEQKLLIYAMWNHNNWEVELVEVPEPRTENVCLHCNANISMAADTEQAGDSNFTDFYIPPNEGETECEHCLCKPCVTSESFRQLWWETENHPANDDNSHYRKNHYRRFWVMLLNRGVWGNPTLLGRQHL